MPKTPYLFLILLIIAGCNNIQSPESTKASITSSQPPKTSFPFTMVSGQNNYSLTFGVALGDLSKQDSILIKHGYYPNGYCYEGHIIQMVESLDKSLSEHIEYDSEAGAFYARIDSEENQFKFVNLLSPIFSDLTKFEEWVNKADHSKIYD